MSPVGNRRRRPSGNRAFHPYYPMRLRLTLVALAALGTAVPAAAQDLSVYRSDRAATQVPYDAATRQTSDRALQATLYELISLKHADHQAHWNVVGQNFYSLHDLLGELYTALGPYIDQVAERQRALGLPADGDPGRVAEGDGLDPFPAGLLDDYRVPMILSDRYYQVAQRVEDRIETVGDAGDPVTQDLLIAVAHELEKHLWMLRALQRGGDGQ